MNLYICYRYNPDDKSPSWWAGVLVVVAESEEQAGQLVVRHERWFPIPENFDYHQSDNWPGKVERVANVTATGEPRIIYDEPER